MSAKTGYSSTVSIVLKVGHEELQVAQVTDDMLILREDPGFDLSGAAALIVTVDGEDTEYRITLRKATERRDVLSYS